ncbi:MAG TPA: PDZ domain-containing protein [Kofleriaceae bacterium]
MMVSPEQLTKLANALGGLPVLGCKPDSPAARAGIRYGDVVLAVNGMPTPDWSAYAEARRQRAGSMQVEIFRGGEELAIELVFDAAPSDLSSWLDYLTSDSA